MMDADRAVDDPREASFDDAREASFDDAREASFDDDDFDDDLAGMTIVFTNGHESLSPVVGAHAVKDDARARSDEDSMMTRDSDADEDDRGVRALSDSESDDSDVDDADVVGPRRAWSAYDAEAAARVRGDGAMREVEAREREREAARAEAAARLNARGRPKRGVVLKAQEARQEAEKSKKTTPTKTTTAVEEEDEEEEDSVDVNEAEEQCEGEETALSLRMSAAAETVQATTSEIGAKGKGNRNIKRRKVDASTKDDTGSVESVRVLLSSGYSDRQRKDLTKKIQKLGGTVVESIADFTVFVTEPPLKRTKNVMASVLRGCPIAKTCWVEKSSKRGNFYPPRNKPFILRDKKFETEHGYDPVSTRERNPFAGKTYFFDTVPRGSDPTMTPKGVRTVIEELLSVAGASLARSGADFVIRLREGATPRDDETRAGYIPWYTPSEILAACVNGSLPRAP